MVVNKPTILIYTNHPDPACLRDVCAGIEEEGVLYQVLPQEEKDVSYLAFRAANDSILGSGVGISQRAVSMQIRGVKNGEDVFRYQNPDSRTCRHLGANSARAIKKMSFVIED